MRVDLDDADRFGSDAQTMRFHQCLCRFRQFAEAIDQFFLQIVDGIQCCAIGETLVDRQAFVHIAAIRIGQ
jgi:hypothetical protein